MNKNLLKAFQIVTLNTNKIEITDERIIKAVTLNSNLKSLGYTFKPNDLIKLASCDDLELDSLYNNMVSYIGDVKAKPMYPDFPNQVMRMDEATFRFHQLVHYFSTYGIEQITGLKVTKGWLPKVEYTEKLNDQELLIDLKVLELVDVKNINKEILDRCFGKAERLTIMEQELVLSAINNIDFNNYSFDIKFKENIVVVFDTLFSAGYKDINYYKFCKHTGDVLRCLEYELDKHKYHFKTSQKRLFVKLFESYPAVDFSSNLILSRKHAETNKKLLRYIDYNEYSKSIDHKLIVDDLRSNLLTSWEGKVKKMIFDKNINAICKAAEHPGTFLRMITLLYRNLKYASNLIIEELEKVSDKLSTQTLVTLCNYFYGEDTNLYNGECRDTDEVEFMRSILIKALKINLYSKDIPELTGKKIYIDDSKYNLELSSIECNDKSEESGYITSGLAFNIPENIDILRLFVYWNDSKCVDIDLHAYGKTIDDLNVNVGWNDDFKSHGIIHSGDITHSNAAEYIDIDIKNTNLKYVNTSISVYTCEFFKDIDECFVGMMAVNDVNESIKLYDPKNCFYTHYLNSERNRMEYAYIDCRNRCLVFVGKDKKKKYVEKLEFNVMEYINILIYSHRSSIVLNKEDADVILTLDKSLDSNNISLIDNNYFMDR